ncbi:hypothetical protein PTI98_012931 [Pleurotus ostreatus]|nr:hypothetical protein PTI98_012931 [Pleurotus ostreatus]
MEADATKALLVAQGGNATKQEVRVAITKINRWKVVAIAQHAKPQIVERLLRTGEQLKSIIDSLVIQREQTRVTSKGKGRLSHASSDLSTPEDIEEILLYYHDLFSASSEEATDSVLEPDVSEGGFWRSEGQDSVGVEFEMTLDDKVLNDRLGFHDNLPSPFNKTRDRMGGNLWDGAKLAEEDNEPFSLRPHQTMGVHALLRSALSSSSSDQCPGVLIADEMGLGKTFQSAALIGFFVDISFRHERGVDFPKILQETPYLGSHRLDKALPNLPYLFIVPPTLLDQWVGELKTCFKKGLSTCSSIRLNLGKHFGRRRGFLQEPTTDESKTHCYLSLPDFALIYTYQPPTTTLLKPWVDAKRKPLGNSVDKTLFDLKYLVVTIDEAHTYRNPGVKQCAATTILSCSSLRLAMTGTPLQTSTRDLSAMGRLINVPWFATDEAYQQERDDMKTIRRLSATKNRPADQDGLQEARVQISTRIKNRFKGRILCRSPGTIGQDGKPLVNLPQKRRITLEIEPTPREKVIFEKNANTTRADFSGSDAQLLVMNRGFYVPHRLCIAYPRIGKEEEDANGKSLPFFDPIPHFNSLEEWQPMKSTKIQSAVDLCVHFLASDEAGMPYVLDGVLVLPPMPDEATPSRQNKILIYQEYPSLGPLLRNILTLHGIQPLWIDGGMNTRARSKIVKKFHASDEFRVLIISSVGSTGLNLAIANIVVFVDQPWSALEQHQIENRCYRQPQKKDVLCFMLLIRGTADIILASHALGKRDLSESFLPGGPDPCQENWEGTNYIQGILTQKSLALDAGEEMEIDGEDISGTGKTPSRRKSKPKTEKPVTLSAPVTSTALEHMDDAITIDVEEKQVDENRSGTGKTSRRKSKSKKEKPVTLSAPVTSTALENTDDATLPYASELEDDIPRPSDVKGKKGKQSFPGESSKNGAQRLRTTDVDSDTPMDTSISSAKPRKHTKTFRKKKPISAETVEDSDGENDNRDVSVQSKQTLSDGKQILGTVIGQDVAGTHVSKSASTKKPLTSLVSYSSEDSQPDNHVSSDESSIPGIPSNPTVDVEGLIPDLQHVDVNKGNSTAGSENENQPEILVGDDLSNNEITIDLDEDEDIRSFPSVSRHQSAEPSNIPLFVDLDSDDGMTSFIPTEGDLIDKPDMDVGDESTSKKPTISSHRRNRDPYPDTPQKKRDKDSKRVRFSPRPTSPTPGSTLGKTKLGRKAEGSRAGRLANLQALRSGANDHLNSGVEAAPHSSQETVDSIGRGINASPPIPSELSNEDSDEFEQPRPPSFLQSLTRNKAVLHSHAEQPPHRQPTRFSAHSTDVELKDLPALTKKPTNPFKAKKRR